MDQHHKEAYEFEKKFLQDRFPALFLAIEEPLPMKIGIFDDILRAVDDALTEDQVEHFLSRWSSRREYRISLMAGGPRYDLDGRECGMVLEEHQRSRAYPYACRLVKRLNSRHLSARVSARPLLDELSQTRAWPALLSISEEICRQNIPKNFYRKWPFVEAR